MTNTPLPSLSSPGFIAISFSFAFLLSSSLGLSGCVSIKSLIPARPEPAAAAVKLPTDAATVAIKSKAAPVAVNHSASTETFDGKVVRFGFQYSGKNIDISGTATPGAKLVQEIGEGEQMLFLIQPAGKDSHTIEHLQSGLCVGITSTNPSSSFSLEPCSPFLRAQQFIFSENSDGSYQIMSELDNLCLDVEKVSRKSGAAITQWDCLGSKNQRVEITITDPNPKVDGGRGTDLAEFTTGEVSLSPNHSGGWVGLYEDQTLAGTPFAQVLDPKRKQFFKIFNEGSGQYSIRHPATGLCLAIGRDSVNNFGAAELEACTEASARFTFFKRAPRSFQIKNIHSARCLDVEAGLKTESARLIQWFCKGGENQTFKITPK